MTERNVSASSNTRTTRQQDPLGKKRKRGPPPSGELRPIDMQSLASQEDVPADIKAALAAGQIRFKTPDAKQNSNSSSGGKNSFEIRIDPKKEVRTDPDIGTPSG